MAWTTENGYTPDSIEDLQLLVLQNINEIFSTTYDIATFRGTNWYRLTYPVLQTIRQVQINFAENMQLLMDFFEEQGKRINMPITTKQGMITYFKDNGGYLISTVRTDDARLMLIVDIDPSTMTVEQKEEIIKLEADSWIAGCLAPTTSDIEDLAQTGDYIFSNGQSETFKFYTPKTYSVVWTLNIEVSRNWQGSIDDVDTIKQKLLDNLNTLYSMGRDLEPEIYFQEVRDANYAGDIELQYTISDKSIVTPTGDTLESLPWEKFTFRLEDINVNLT